MSKANSALFVTIALESILSDIKSFMFVCNSGSLSDSGRIKNADNDCSTLESADADLPFTN
jgi:hypothetical protein